MARILVVYDGVTGITKKMAEDVAAGELRLPREHAAGERLGERLAQWVTVYREGRMDLHPRGQR
jgi:hypothetical protein